MATHDYVIDNSTGANVRADLNLVLQAILSNNSSSSAPSTTAAYMWWADTTNGILKIRNSANNAWVELLQLDGTLTLEDGSASTPALAFRDDLDTGIFSDAANEFNVATGGVERFSCSNAAFVVNQTGADVDFRIESSGTTHMFYLDAGNNRIGLNRTAPLEMFEVGGNIYLTSNSSNANDGNALKFQTKTSGFSTSYGAAIHGLRVGDTSSYLRFDTGGQSEKMRLDSSGRVYIANSGLSATAEADDLVIGNLTGGHGLTIHSQNNEGGFICFGDTDTTGADSRAGVIRYQHSDNSMRFATNGNNERMRLTSTGTMQVSNTGSFSASNPTYHDFSANSANDLILRLRNTSSTNPYGVNIAFDAAAPNDTTRYAIQFVDSSAIRFQLRSNGGISNFSGNNVNLCDEREKKNIVSLDTKWDKVKNWELKKFHYNEDADTDDLRYGVIAQQVEEHCPEVLTDWIKQTAEDAVLDEDGNVVKEAVAEIARKGVKEQQMMWMAIKALQEAQTRIETLETKVAALEAA